MKNANRTIPNNRTGKILTAILAGAIALSFAPIHNGANAIATPGIGHAVDSTAAQIGFRLVDVTPRITDSGKCQFLLRDGEVLFVEPGFHFESPEAELNNDQAEDIIPSLETDQNIIQLINAKFQYHE